MKRKFHFEMLYKLILIRRNYKTLYSVFYIVLSAQPQLLQNGCSWLVVGLGITDNQ